MRFLFFVLLVTTALLAHGGAGTGTEDSNTATPGILSVARQYEARVPRLLRVGETINNEERALPPIPVPTIAKFTEWIKSMGIKFKNNIQARYWLWKKHSAEDVFKQLKLDGGLEKILANPKFRTWSTYIDLLNKKNPGKEVTMAGILTKTYGDLALARMLEFGLNSNVRSQRGMARRLTSQQRGIWKADGKNADDVFTLLKLDKVGDEMFVSPQLNTWYNYVTMIEKKEDAQKVMVSVLRTHYGDEALSKIFLEANPRVKRMGWIRVKLETAVGQSQQNKALTDSTKTLTGPAKELTGPAKALTGPTNTAKEPEKTISPEEYFKVLKLDAGVDQLLTNPNLATWIRYASQFNEKNPGNGVTMIKTFTKFYGDDALAKMLQAATLDPKTEKVAEQLQTGQFKQWLRDGKSPT